MMGLLRVLNCNNCNIILCFTVLKVHNEANLFLHGYENYSLKYMIPKFEMLGIKISNFTSAESWAFAPKNGIQITWPKYHVMTACDIILGSQTSIKVVKTQGKREFKCISFQRMRL